MFLFDVQGNLAEVQRLGPLNQVGEPPARDNVLGLVVCGSLSLPLLLCGGHAWKLRHQSANGKQKRGGNVPFTPFQKEIEEPTREKPLQPLTFLVECSTKK